MTKCLNLHVYLEYTRDVLIGREKKWLKDGGGLQEK